MALQQITGNVFADTSCRGCNFGLLTTSEGIVMFDSPHKPSDSMALKAEIQKEVSSCISSIPNPMVTTGQGIHSSTCRSSLTKRSDAE